MPILKFGPKWVDGEVLEILWSLLNNVSGSTRSMTSSHQQELLDFQMNDSNFMKMIRMTNTLAQKLKHAQKASASAAAIFKDLDSMVSESQQQEWGLQEKEVQERRISDPSAMDIFDLYLPKDQLSMEISAFLAKAKIHLSPNYEDGIQWGDSDSDCDYASEECTLQDANEDLLDRVDGNRPDRAYIPLPSNIGCSKCVNLGLQNLVDMELKLQVLPWYFNLDMEHDTESSTWMLEFLRVHWLRAKVTKDQWIEEEELLHSEFEWTISFFKHHIEQWREQAIRS
ncbi:hypothetical protein V8E55_006995 [Tylopilus felleus]